MPKRKTPSCKVVRSTDLSAVAHRAAVSRCPECDAEFDMEAAAKLARALVLDTYCGKHGSVVVVSECPACFKPSWLHYEFSWFQDYQDVFPADLKKAAMGEHDARHLAAVRRFADSLCARCAHLRGLECDTLPVAKCTDGKDEKAKLSPGRTFYYRNGFTETECKSFTQRISA